MKRPKRITARCRCGKVRRDIPQRLAGSGWRKLYGRTPPGPRVVSHMCDYCREYCRRVTYF